MGPENGGLVLDVSDGGLSFHSVAPVQPAETIHFLLSLRGHSRIEGAGEVVWTNEMKTVCGLKFTSLSSGAREHLNNWTNQSRMSRPLVKIRRPLRLANGAIRFPFDQWTAARAPVCYPSRRRAFHPEPKETTLGGKLLLWTVFGLLASVSRRSVPLRPACGAIRNQIAGAHRAESAPQETSQSIPVLPSPLQRMPQNAACPSAAPSFPNVATSAPSSALVNASKTDDAAGNASKSPGARKSASATPDPRTQSERQANRNSQPRWHS